MEGGETMTLSDFQILTSEQLEGMTIAELKSLVSSQGKKLNKRISHIKGNPEANQSAVRVVEVSGGRFGVSGKETKRALISEAKREQKFMNMKTSTVRGAMKVHEQSEKAVVGITARQYAQNAGKAWEESEKERLRQQGKKMTKRTQKSISRKKKLLEKKAKKVFNKKIGDAWEQFHKWKEENSSFTYSKDSVKQIVNDYAVGESVVNIPEDLKPVFNISVIYDKEKNQVWNTVSDKTFRKATAEELQEAKDMGLIK